MRSSEINTSASDHRHDGDRRSNCFGERPYTWTVEADTNAEDRDHPLVMHYDVAPEWLDPVRCILPRGSRRHERAQAQLLAAAIDKARARIPSLSYSRRRAYYAQRGKRYELHPDLCTYDLIVPNVDLLADLGLLDNEIAAADPTSGRQSTFRAGSFLIETFGDIPPPAAKRKPRALIQLRNAEKQPIDYRDTDQTDRWRHRLLEINEMVSSLIVGLPPGVDRTRGDLAMTGDSVVNLRSTTLYRVFNNDFKHGGRFYGHFVQGLPKEVRERLTLNDEEIAEPDYKAHHPRILYALEGQPLPADPYEVDGWERKIAKLALVIMINAPSWQSARGAITRRVGLSADEARELVHQLEHRHAPIAKYFHSGAGRRLQWYDSRMAECILIEATRQGIHVLPIHDSFIVSAQRKANVEELMDQAFHRVIFDTCRTSAIPTLKQEVISKPFYIGLESLESLPPPLLSSTPSGLFAVNRRLTQRGRLALADAKRRRCIAQGTFASLVGISRPALANILAGRFGTSPEVAERIARVVLTTPAHELQPFLPGLAA